MTDPNCVKQRNDISSRAMNIVTSQMTGFIHKAAPLPGQTWIPIRILSTLHWYWRWNYKKKIYANPDNWIMLAVGSVANAYISNDSWLRTIAHIILITHRTKLYVQQVKVLAKSVSEFYAATKGNYILVSRMEWDPTAPNLDKIKTYKLRRINTIHITFFRMMKELYSAAMHAVEIYDAFYRRQEAFNEVFVNARECIEDVLKSNYSIKNYFKENQKTIAELLDHYQMLSVDQLLGKV
jgi:hypothetical protein